MFLPPTVTARTSGFSLIPLQSGQALMLIQVSIFSLNTSEAPSLYLRSSMPTIPSNGSSRYDTALVYLLVYTNLTGRPIVPYISSFRNFLGSSLYGVLRSTLCSAASASTIERYQPPSFSRLLKAATKHPSSTDLSLSATIRSGSIYCVNPSPLQVGQAPKGLLKENILGSSSSILMPCSGQASLVLNVLISSPARMFTRPSP